MSTLKVNELLNTSGSILPRIIQVQVTTSNTHDTKTQGGELTTYRTNITPTSSSSKILLIAHMGCISSGGSYDGGISFMRDGSDISDSIGSGGSDINTSFVSAMDESTTNAASSTGIFLDDPNTTSQITYSLKANPNSGETMFINRRGHDTTYAFRSSLICIEIGGI